MAKSEPVAGARTRRQAKARSVLEEEILETAARLFAERGFGATGFDQIAGALGLQRPSLYHYFASKDDMLVRLVADLVSSSEAALREIKAARELEPVRRLVVTVEALLGPILEAPHRFRLLLTAETDLPEDLAARWVAVRRGLVSEVGKVIRDGIASRAFRSVDPDTATFTVLGMCNWVAWWPAAQRSGDRAVAPVIAQLAAGALVGGRPEGPPDADPVAVIRAIEEQLAVLRQLVYEHDRSSR